MRHDLQAVTSSGSPHQKITFAASWTMRGPAEVVGVPNAESLVRVVPFTP